MDLIPIGTSNKHLKFFGTIILALSILSSGCGNASQQSAKAQPTGDAAKQQNSLNQSETLSQAEVTFLVTIPEATPTSAEIFVDLLDEVTGLALNPTRYQMEAKDNHQYQVSVPIALGSVVKYRYTRGTDSSAVEYNTQNETVRYRMAVISAPITVTDIVSSWSDMAYAGVTGRILGTIVDQNTQAGIQGLLITTGGFSTVSGADGAFLIDGLIPGTHNVAVYAMDGSYPAFQQGAMIAENSSTPFDISLAQAKMVNITFNLTIPSENVVGVPVRIAGNLSQTGNTFADLASGVNSLAAKMPVMNMNEDGSYSLTLSLPAGTDFRYKYTLGDGFWNGELNSDGTFRVRQIIVPESDTTFQESVTTWRYPNVAPVSFTVQVPEETPTTDYVSIDFNPFGWTESLPMWSLGNNQWVYVLYNPMKIVGEISYRYCRNDQCGAADNAATPTADSSSGKFSQSSQDQSFVDTIQSWEWWSKSSNPTTVNAANITSRGSDFIAGIEYQAGYNPTWQTRYYSAAASVASLGANWLVYTPTWSYSRINTPILESIPGRDQSWSDAVTAISQSEAVGLNVAIFPATNFPTTSGEFWEEGTRDFSWWEVWFNRYHEFIVDQAALATATGAQALILGGEGISPALPGGTLASGSSSGVPEDAAARWINLIKDIRSVYTGKIYWAVNYPDQVSNPPSFLDQVDGIYVMISSSLTDQVNPNVSDLETKIGSILDVEIKTLKDIYSKPIIIGAYYASADGGAESCIPLPSGSCAASTELAQPNDDVASVSVDLQEQVDIYNAFFAQVNQRDWISGFVSRGFYMPVALQDKSASINGKPAQDVVWYWFPRLTGQTQ